MSSFDEFYKGLKNHPNLFQNITRRNDLVSGDHDGYCDAIEHMLINFKVISHIGGCCGTLPEGIRALRRRFF